MPHVLPVVVEEQDRTKAGGNWASTTRTRFSSISSSGASRAIIPKDTDLSGTQRLGQPAFVTSSRYHEFGVGRIVENGWPTPCRIFVVPLEEEVGIEPRNPFPRVRSLGAFTI